MDGRTSGRWTSKGLWVFALWSQSRLRPGSWVSAGYTHKGHKRALYVKATSSKRDKSVSAPYLDKFEVALVEVGEWGSGCCDGLTRTLRH